MNSVTLAINKLNTRSSLFRSNKSETKQHDNGDGYEFECENDDKMKFRPSFLRSLDKSPAKMTKSPVKKRGLDLNKVIVRPF